MPDSGQPAGAAPGAAAVVAEATALTRRIVRSWATVRKAYPAWDFQNFDKALADLTTALAEAHGGWPSRSEALVASLRGSREFTRTEQYVQQLEDALREAGLGPQKTGPAEFAFPPFKLDLKLAEGYARLLLGRKAERATELAPKNLAAWIRKRYDRVTKSKFDSERFKKDLFLAFQVGTQIKYGGDVKWGYAVELKLIYELLTLRAASRQDYPRELFLFDLARLLAIPNLEHSGQRFEFGFARGQDKIFVVTDSDGKEMRLASLTVYDKEPANG
ncbi:MAG: hypothetical protein FJZ01_14695 [Candidatus Sericytochromatia bacterium]|nr:hypothetical protein [Candidatus Tanganyikabacteria bacterium]